MPALVQPYGGIMCHSCYPHLSMFSVDFRLRGSGAIHPRVITLGFIDRRRQYLGDNFLQRLPYGYLRDMMQI